MNKILIAIPYSSDNAVLTERLIDWIFTLSKKTQGGHAVLVVDGDVHNEMRQKVKLSADVAFSSVTEVPVSGLPKDGQAPWVRCNRLFMSGSMAIRDGFRLPFLWMEPECVPTQNGWIDEIEEAYEDQPKRYMGSLMKRGNELYMSRLGVYPCIAATQLGKMISDKVPFEVSCGPFINPFMTRTKVFQQLPYMTEEDFPKVRDNAAIVYGDSTGALIEMLRQKVSGVKMASVEYAKD